MDWPFLGRELELAEITRALDDPSCGGVLLIGPPGVGKTHLAVGLGRAAAEAGYRTYFTTAADLAARCHRAAIEGRWATTMASTQARPCSSSTNWATSRYPPRPPRRCSRSSPSATASPPSS